MILRVENFNRTYYVRDPEPRWDGFLGWLIEGEFRVEGDAEWYSPGMFRLRRAPVKLVEDQQAVAA